MLQKNFPSGQAAEYRNLVRWYDLIQHTTPLTAHFPEVELRKPGIPAPPVVVPPAKVPSQLNMSLVSAICRPCSAGCGLA